MGISFEMALASLGPTLDYANPFREALARKIIELARAGGRDPERLCEDALYKHGAPKYALHAMRHFYASWCINRKADGGRELPAKNVQQLLGHSSIVITMDTYGHLFRPHPRLRQSIS
jgi:integrase